jgi:hypothetical protein
MSKGPSWLPAGFEHPLRVELPTGHHLRPIRATDVQIDYLAVMGSQASLWTRFGESWGWPPASMTIEEDLADLARHEREIKAHESFNYAILDAEESELLGCIYIEPPTPRDQAPPGTDAVTSWWVVDSHVGGPLEFLLAEFVPRWLCDEWGFRSVAEMR